MILNSYWIPFILSLAPLIATGFIVVLIILLGYNSRMLSDAIGYGMSKRRAARRKKSNRFQWIVTLAAWGAALSVLLYKCGGILSCTNPLKPYSNSTDAITNSVAGNTNTTIPIIATANQISSFVLTSWVYPAFLGLLVIASAIFARGAILSWKQTRDEVDLQAEISRAEAIASVEDAFRILRAQQGVDPRTRIISCYQRMIQAAQGSGARVTSDQTARELEVAIRNMLNIDEPAIRNLTDLFEEARYSLHPIGEDDAEMAQQYLQSIAQKMNIVLSG